MEQLPSASWPVRTSIAASLLILTFVTNALQAQQAEPSDDSAEIEAMRSEIRELRALVLSLQDQVRALSGESAAPPGAEPRSGPPPAPVPTPAPVARRSASRNVMNPAISAVFLGAGNTSLRRRDNDNGWDLSEAEIAFQSVVDPYARVDLYLAFPEDETPEVEEGAVTTLAMPGSLQLKGGRFKSAFGKWNSLHSHAFFTVDRPDVLGLFFGEESFTNDGLSASFLVPNPWDLYIESISEVGTAREGTAFNSSDRALTYLQHLSAFFNVGQSSTLEVGVSASRGVTGPSRSLLEALDDPNAPSGLQPDERLASAVQGLDLTYKWRPPQRNLYRSFLWQTEILRSRREVQKLTPLFDLDAGAVTSLGGYSYLEAQFVKRWRTGLRVDVSGLPQDERGRMWAASTVVRFQPSEFQELRFQVRHSRLNERAAMLTGEDREDTRILFQWIPIIGAHGAHEY